MAKHETALEAVRLARVVSADADGRVTGSAPAERTEDAVSSVISGRPSGGNTAPFDLMLVASSAKIVTRPLTPSQRR